MKVKIHVYTKHSGIQPFYQWLNSIKDLKTNLRIRTRIDRLAVGNYGDYEFINDGVYELRLCFGKGYRIYFVETDGKIILLLGGDKSSQKNDIKKSKSVLAQN